LFSAAGASPHEEARRMVALARALLDGDDPETASESAWEALEGTARAVFDPVWRGALPLAALEVAAGLTGLGRPKDYGVKPIWNLAWQISSAGEDETEEDALLDEETLEMIASMETDHGPEAARIFREGLEEDAREVRIRMGERARKIEATIEELVAQQPEERRERHRRIIRETYEAAGILRGVAPRGGGGRQATPEESAVADRIAPLGAGGQSRSELGEIRRILWQNRACGPAWEGLCMAFDVVGAGSHAGLDRLGAIAGAAPESPALLWLDEISCCVGREETRAARRAAALDALLASGRFGRNAPAIASSVRMGREMLEERGDKVHDAWLRLAAVTRHEIKMPRLGEDTSPVERAAIRRAARGGDKLAKLVLDMEKQSERIVEAERSEADQEGPFHGLGAVPKDIESALDEAAHYTVMGFRELYGLELLRDALPKLEQALSAGG
jgi:hypothetical protein